MDIFGIGPLELFFIILLVIIIFGPKDIQKASKTAGAWLRKVVQSDLWKTVNQASRKIRTLPNDLMREAGIDEIKQTIAPLQSELRQIDAAARMSGPRAAASRGREIPPASAPSPTTESQEEPKE
jgi:sec-independent protein translocase protein TatB